MNATARSAPQHELELHQVELAAQNEELRRVQAALEASRDRYAELYEFAPVGYLTLGGDATITDVNHAGAALLGHERTALLQRPFARFVAAHDAERWQLFFRNALRCFARATCELALHRDDGSPLYVRLDCAPREAAPMALRIALTDITAHKRAEDELRLAAAAIEAQEGIIITDAAGVILRINRAFTEITGYTAEDVVGKTPRVLKSGCHDNAFYVAMWDSIRRTGSWKGEIWDRRKSGELYPKWLSITAVPGDDGVPTHYIGTQTDITERKAAENEIKYLAFYDPLTRLPNRRLLLDRLQQALAVSARNQRQGALLFIDLDNFKQLNDTLGHDQGDLLLQLVAQRLGNCIRDGDTVARLGGDEFVVMLEDLNANIVEAAAQAETVGEKIRTTLGQVYVIAGHDYHSTPSIGVTLFGEQPQAMDELLKQADLAMYQAKAAGRNAVRFFDRKMQAAAAAHLALENDLRNAIGAQQFMLHYQAQVDAAGRCQGAEALLRWRHAERGMVSPAEFIPLAEETGLILPLGHWVLESACRQLAHWADQPGLADLAVAVNVSVVQFRHADFVAEVLAVLQATGANPQRLKLELTESLLATNVEDIIAKMNALKAIGVGFSLDDFGTGYSSLAYLSRLPLDQLKIDRSFVANLEWNDNDAVICAATISLAHALRLKVVAEGVETDAQRYFLTTVHRCDLIQGYLFSRPLPVEEFESFAQRA